MDAQTPNQNVSRIVMIIENDRDFAESLREVLELERYAVIIASGATEAKELAVVHKPPVCLVDIHLGTHDGMDLIPELEALIPGMISVIITAHAGLETAVKAIKQRVYDYLRKPISVPELLAALDRCFGRLEEERRRREAGEALAKSEEFYRTIFEEDITGDFLANADGDIVLCNPPFARIFQFDSVADATGSNLSELFKDATRWLEFKKKLLAEKKLMRHETVLVNRKHGEVNAIANVMAKFDSRGRLLEINGYIMDITDHKLLENMYFQAQKMEAIGRFAGGIAHDFNNMLTVILNYSMILRRSMGEKSREYEDLSEVITAATHASALTRQLLTFSRKESVTPKTVNINDIILELKSMMARILGENIELDTALAADLWLIDADPVQISQILMNLLANSRDAMPGGGKVLISTHNTLLDEKERALAFDAVSPEFAVCEVRDSGIGMDDETRRRIFEPFFTTKEIGKGTGLGLSTVFGIVRQRGGFITCDSEENSGSVFRLYFPKSSQPANKEKPAAESATPGRVEGTILVVEDNEGLNRLVVRLLRNEGCTVVSAANGRQALERFQASVPPVTMVVTDIMMPEMGGEELVRRLIARAPQIKVLFMSGYVDDILKRPDFRNRPGMDLILKPFTGEEIMERIQALLSRKG